MSPKQVQLKLTKLLESEDLELRRAVIRVVAEIGLSTRGVVQALGRCLREPHEDLRMTALEALSRLGGSDPQLSQIVEMRFFGGMTESEIAEVLGVSARTVERSWRFARMWLCRELEQGESDVA